MKSVKNLIGIKILEIKTGKEIGKVKEVLFSEKKVRILGLLVNQKGIFKEARAIQYKNVDNIGEDVIIIKDKKIIEKLNTLPSLYNSYKEKNDIIGLEVFSDNGESLGYIDDIVFEEKNGKVMGFILTDGFIQDILEGKNTLPFNTEISIMEDTIIINKKIKDNYEENKDDFKKLLELD